MDIRVRRKRLRRIVATEEVYRITPRKTAEFLHGPPRRTQEGRRDTESSRPLHPLQGPQHEL